MKYPDNLEQTTQDPAPISSVTGNLYLVRRGTTVDQVSVPFHKFSERVSKMKKYQIRMFRYRYSGSRNVCLKATKRG